MLVFVPREGAFEVPLAICYSAMQLRANRAVWRSQWALGERFGALSERLFSSQ